MTTEERVEAAVVSYTKLTKKASKTQNRVDFSIAVAHLLFRLRNIQRSLALLSEDLGMLEQAVKLEEIGHEQS